MIHPTGELETIALGRQIETEQSLQAVVPAGSWFASRVEQPEGFALVGCTVSPGFDFEDFEMAKRSDLLNEFSQHEELIIELTRN